MEPTLIDDHDHVVQVALLIPLRRNSLDSQMWESICRRLAATCASLKHQTGKRFRVVIAGLEKPQCLEANRNERIQIVKVDFEWADTQKR